MFSDPSLNNSLQPTWDVASLENLVVDLDAQTEELVSGGNDLQTLQRLQQEFYTGLGVIKGTLILNLG